MTDDALRAIQLAIAADHADERPVVVQFEERKIKQQSFTG